MTKQILFLIVIMIGAFYARKHGKKAKATLKITIERKTMKE